MNIKIRETPEDKVLKSGRSFEMTQPRLLIFSSVL